VDPVANGIADWSKRTLMDEIENQHGLSMMNARQQEKAKTRLTELTR
jgi:hypothetical protein